MLRRIKLYGRLAKFVGAKVLEADVATAAEAVRFLLANWPQLEQHMADQHYRVKVGAEDLPLDTAPDELHYPAGAAEISIIPVVAGAGAVGRIIAGIALIALAAFVPLGATLGPIVMGIGVSLTLGGVAELLMPVPKTSKDEADPRKSFSFSGIQNTSRQGTPVPFIGGEVICGSVVISAGIDIVQVTA